MDSNQQPEVLFKIIRVKDLAFHLNEQMYDQSIPDDQRKVNLICELRFNTDVNYVFLDIIASYFYEKQTAENPFASITVQTVFQVDKLISFVRGDDLYLPPLLIVTFVGMCLSHTRALFSKAIDGTAFTSVILPLIYPMDFARKVFPHMFDEIIPIKKTKKAKV